MNFADLIVQRIGFDRNPSSSWPFSPSGSTTIPQPAFDYSFDAFG